MEGHLLDLASVLRNSRSPNSFQTDMHQAFKDAVEQQYAHPKAQADLELKQAQARRTGIGGDLTGAAGNIYKLQRMMEMGIIDPTTAKEIQGRMDLDEDALRATMERSKKLTETQDFRNATPLQKKQMELKALEENRAFDEHGNKYEMSPEERSRRMDSHMMQIMQDTTDQPWRTKMGNMRNMHTTLMSVNPEQAFKYSGGIGGVSDILNKGGALIGVQSEDYKRFQEELTKLELLSDQASQYFDIPAAREIQKRIHELADPNSWFRDPDTAMRKYQALVDLFEKEAANTMKAGVDAGFYNPAYQSQGARQSPQRTEEDLIVEAFSGGDASSRIQDINSRYPKAGITIELLEKKAGTDKNKQKEWLDAYEAYLGKNK